jgi:hypothetical protein
MPQCNFSSQRTFGTLKTSYTSRGCMQLFPVSEIIAKEFWCLYHTKPQQATFNPLKHWLLYLPPALTLKEPALCTRENHGQFNRCPRRESKWTVPTFKPKAPNGLVYSKTLDLHSGCVWFEYRPGHRLPWLRFFMVFLSLQEKAWIGPQFGHGRLISNH